MKHVLLNILLLCFLSSICWSQQVYTEIRRERTSFGLNYQAGVGYQLPVFQGSFGAKLNYKYNLVPKYTPNNFLGIGVHYDFWKEGRFIPFMKVEAHTLIDSKREYRTFKVPHYKIATEESALNYKALQKNIPFTFDISMGVSWRVFSGFYLGASIGYGYQNLRTLLLSKAAYNYLQQTHNWDEYLQYERILIFHARSYTFGLNLRYVFSKKFYSDEK